MREFTDDHFRVDGDPVKVTNEILDFLTVPQVIEFGTRYRKIRNLEDLYLTEKQLHDIKAHISDLLPTTRLACQAKIKMIIEGYDCLNNEEAQLYL